MHNLKASSLAAVLVAAFILTQCQGYPIRSPSEGNLSQGLGMVTSPESDAKSSGRPRARSRNRRHREHPESEDEDDQMQMVTIDLSALRPSLPGLVLYKYGEQAPKLVQVDLDALNPQIQPHVIWPEFTGQANDIGDSYYDFVRENLDANEDIPFLDEEDSLVPMHNQQMSRMTMEGVRDVPNFSELADGDIYDFMPGSFRNEELMTLQHSLPLADEIIVPLDWEEKAVAKDSTIHEAKKNVFVSRGWKPGGEPHPRAKEKAAPSGPGEFSRGTGLSERVRYSSPFGSNGWRPGKRQLRRNLEKEEEFYEKDRSGYASPAPQYSVDLEKGEVPATALSRHLQPTQGRMSWNAPANQWRPPTTRY